MKSIDAWHFLQADCKTRYTNESVVVGKKLSVKGKLSLCEHGLHASTDILSAFGYAPFPIICRVRLTGQILHDEDKLCARHREVIAMADATQVLQLFIVDCLDQIRTLDINPFYHEYLNKFSKIIRQAVKGKDVRSVAIDEINKFNSNMESWSDNCTHNVLQYALNTVSSFGVNEIPYFADVALYYCRLIRLNYNSINSERKWQTDQLTERFNKLLKLG